MSPWHCARRYAPTGTWANGGLGPYQSYPNTGQGARTGWFSLPLADMDVDYVRPQESGARSGVRSAALDAGGRRLEVAGEPFALTVRSYSLAALDAATHQPHRVADGCTYLYLDHAMREWEPEPAARAFSSLTAWHLVQRASASPFGCWPVAELACFRWLSLSKSCVPEDTAVNCDGGRSSGCPLAPFGP